MRACDYVVRKGTDRKAAEHCGKMAAPNSFLCPKHELMTVEYDAEQKRKMAKVRAAKEQRAMLRELLKESPLAAYNPAFDEKRRTGYDQ